MSIELLTHLKEERQKLDLVVERLTAEQRQKPSDGGAPSGVAMGTVMV